MPSKQGGGERKIKRNKDFGQSNKAIKQGNGETKGKCDTQENFKNNNQSMVQGQRYTKEKWKRKVRSGLEPETFCV